MSSSVVATTIHAKCPQSRRQNVNAFAHFLMFEQHQFTFNTNIYSTQHSTNGLNQATVRVVLRVVFDDKIVVLLSRVAILVVSLFAANIAVIVAWALISFGIVVTDAGDEDHSMFATGMLAFALGLRHACDADHIAAIDNVTRRLALLGRESLFVGGYFALGHSTIVCVLCVAVAFSSRATSQWLSDASDVASIVARAISLAFLLVSWLVVFLFCFLFCSIALIYLNDRCAHS